MTSKNNNGLISTWCKSDNVTCIRDVISSPEEIANLSEQYHTHEYYSQVLLWQRMLTKTDSNDISIFPTKYLTPKMLESLIMADAILLTSIPVSMWYEELVVKAIQENVHNLNFQEVVQYIPTMNKKNQSICYFHSYFFGGNNIPIPKEFLTPEFFITMIWYTDSIYEKIPEEYRTKALSDLIVRKVPSCIPKLPVEHLANQVTE